MFPVANVTSSAIPIVFVNPSWSLGLIAVTLEKIPLYVMILVTVQVL